MPPINSLQETAAGDLTQVARGDQVASQLAFRFKDGSRQEETTVFSQRGNSGSSPTDRISTCVLPGVAASGSPVAVRYKEGLVHGFLVLRTMDGVAIIRTARARKRKAVTPYAQVVARSFDAVTAWVVCVIV
ncbi:MAG: hypothetical protein WB660_17940 [Candidatus Sulfotelmatobacter sp.]